MGPFPSGGHINLLTPVVAALVWCGVRCGVVWCVRREGDS